MTADTTMTRADLAARLHAEVGLSHAELSNLVVQVLAADGHGKREERQDLGLRQLHSPRQGRACRAQPQDRRRSADRAAPSNDLSSRSDDA